MKEFIDFNKKYKDIILGELTPDLYYDSKEHISNIIDEMVDTEVLKLEDLDRFTEFATVYLLTRRSADRILKESDEVIMGDIITAYIKYNEKYGIKASADLSKVEATKKQKENNEAHRKEYESKTYIRSILNNIKGIFASGTDLIKLTNELYESLEFDGYKDKQIVSGSADKAILDCIRNQYFDIKFNDDFQELFKYSRDKTNEIFRNNERNSELSLVEKNFYQGYNNLGNISFKVAIGLNAQGIDVKQARTSSDIEGYIQNNINSEIARLNSVRKAQEKELRKETRVKFVEDVKTDFKKKAIVFAIAFGIFAADNIIYNALHNDKKEDNNKTKKEPTTYSVNSEYKPGSYLEDIDWDSVRKNGSTLEDAIENHDWDQELKNLRG